MERHCADARYVWNLALEQMNCWRRHLGPAPVASERGRQLTEVRKDSWLGTGSSAVQREALRDFDQALRNWWNGTHGRPTWRKKGINEGFVVRDVLIRPLSRKWATVVVPKLGQVRFRLSRSLPCKYGMGRVTLDRSGRWHVSFSAPQPDVERKPNGAAVGIDLGVVATVTTSDGDAFHLPERGAYEERRVKRLQRRMSRQQKGSNRRARTKHAIAVLRAREKDRRKDWVEKMSTHLVRDHDLVVFEDLKVKNMMRSASGTVGRPGRRVAQKRGLNRAIAAQGWAMLAQRTEQKAAASGVTLVRVNPRHTSQECSACGHTCPENRSGQAVFRCQSCGHAENADVNAARVILARGLRATARGGTPDVRAPSEARTSGGVAA